jgi:hypothetical protein
VKRDKGYIRFLLPLVVAISVSLYWYDGRTHICQCGYFKHPPYPTSAYILVIVWSFLFVLSGVLIWKWPLNKTWKRGFIILTALLFVSRVLLESLGGALIYLEDPLSILLLFFSVFCAWRVPSHAS